MTEDDVYKHLGAAGAATAVAVGASKLGIFRAIKCWWQRPTRTDRLSEALERIGSVVEKMGAAIEHVSETLARMSDNFLIAEAMTRSIADRDPTPMFQCSLPSGDCVWTNRALQAMYGRTREQMLGSGWAEAIVPSMQREVLDKWHLAVASGRFYNCDYPIEVDGRLINVRAHAEFVLDPAGRKIIAIGTVRHVPVLIKEDDKHKETA